MEKRRETVRAMGLETGYRSKRGETVVTRGIDASLYAGELTCLLGPNGAGKSTLMKTLTGFIPALGGRIMVEGRDLDSYSEAELSKLISVVLTERPNVCNMTVEELVTLGRSPYTGFWGRGNEHDREVVDESIHLVGIDELRGRMVSTLSDGERQKVMIAKSLAQQTPVIFLDEPTAFLDYPSKVEIMQLLQRLSREKGKTVFLSTHDLEIALQIADMIWLLDKRHGVTTGTPEDLSLDGAMERYFRHDGIVFDMESGLFRICHALDGKVYVEGTAPYAGMVRKALAREGMEASGDYGLKLRITADETGFYLAGNRYDTIAALLEALRR